jgi:rhodanese-related sulfurtransferase
MFNKKIFLIAAVTLLLFVVSCDEKSTSPDNEFMNVSPAEALELINNNPDLIIIDVSDAWDEGHLPGALSFPLADGSFESAIPTWNMDSKYLIYCHGDSPAITAAQMLVDAGFEHVYRLEGNYGGWVDAGYDIEVAGYMDIMPADALTMINDNPELIIIDVSNMWQFGHLPGALDVPLEDGSLEAAIPTWNANDMYLIYCHTDAASMAAAQMLVDNDFPHVYRLKGNYGAWIDAGYDIEVGPYMDIAPMDALTLMNENPELIIIDVSNMWEMGHLPGAVNYPVGDGTFEAMLPNWDMEKKYLIYCHGDAPAITAAQMLVDNDFPYVYRLEGNYGAWVDAGYDIEVAPYMDIAPMDALALMNENPELIIIDVSNMWEYGHLPGALDVPLGDGSLEAAIPTWNANDMYLIYCHTDAASMAAAQMLVDNDFPHVYRLEGNYSAWVDAGYDIVVETYMDISAMELYQMMMDNPELIIIDVSSMYEQGHIPGAINYYVGDGSLDNAIPILDPLADYAIYCHVDSASILGAEKLIEAGFIHVYRLEGNFSAWVDAGYPVETGPE